MKDNISKSVLGLLLMSFIISVFLTIAKPESMQGDALGPIAQTPEQLVNALTKIEPNTDSERVSAYQIIDNIGIAFSCPKQIGVLVSIQAELEMLSSNRAIESAMDADDPSSTALQNMMRDQEAKIEASLSELEMICSDEDAGVLPEDFDIRFFVDYVNTLPTSCERQESKIQLLKVLNANVQKLEREVLLAKTTGIEKNLKRFQEQILNSRKLIRSVFEDYQMGCENS